VIETVFEQSYLTSSRLAAVRAAVVVTSYRLPTETRRDLEQEALLELWRKRAAFDSRRGSWRTFSETVVTNKLISLVRSMCSQRSSCFKEEQIESALSVVAPDGQADLRADVRRVLAGVSSFDRCIARSLTYSSLAETSRSMGVSRATVYRAIGRLRVAFTMAGFADRRRVRGLEVLR
jgi:DNA-directed RNA polymerase specialized sigma24 family protein